MLKRKGRDKVKDQYCGEERLTSVFKFCNFEKEPFEYKYKGMRATELYNLNFTYGNNNSRKDINFTRKQDESAREQ